MREWDDVPARRTAIFDSVLTSMAKQFPQSYGGVRLEVNDLHYDGPEEFSLADQKRALLSNRYLHRKLKGVVRLVDEATGTPIEERPMTLMKVPVLTQRGTFIHNGSEYTTMHQARLLPGVFTRRKSTGELESHFNVRRGTGNSFRVHLEPDTGLFKMDIGQASLRLYSLLHDLGIPDEKLEAAWGPELLAKNKTKYDPRVFEKAYMRLVRRADPNVSREDKARLILEAMNGAKLNRGVVERTLPNRFNRKVATVWKRGAVMEVPDPVPVPDEKDDFSKADYLLLAQFLNKNFQAGIPLTLPTGELVDVILAELKKAMPNASPGMMEQMMQFKEAARESGCLMAVIRPSEAAPIVNWTTETIKPEDLTVQGIEPMPHVTIRYGFRPGTDVDRLKELLGRTGPVRLTLKEIARFEGVEGGTADCVVVEVESEDLRRLRSEVDSEFSDSLDESTYKEYKPHMTLAYVRLGACKDLVGHAWFSGGTYVLKELTYSTPGAKEKIAISLKDETDSAADKTGAGDDAASGVEGEHGGGDAGSGSGD